MRAILFYSPSCGHCHYVIQEVLPPLIDKYAYRLQIMGVDASQAGGQALFQAALDKFKPPSSGVPFLVVGEHILIGSVDIPEKFPDLIEQYLEQGGVDWPDIPGLDQAISAAETAQAATASPGQDQISPTTTPSPEKSPPESTAMAPITPTPTIVNVLITGNTNTGVWERLTNDPLGNILAIVVLLGMITALVGLVFYLRRNPEKSGTKGDWLIPVLCVVGIIVAGYLSFVEVTQTSAVCGPVGDCNTVQQSEYARLFGVLPIGVLGLSGYAAMGIAWLISQLRRDQFADLASVLFFGMCLFGVLFSIYLTFLEPFVIGATCAWCLTSAVLITILLWLSAIPAMRAYSRLQRKSGLKRSVE